MPKPICVPCQRFFRPLKNGVWVLENRPIGSDVKAGLTEPHNWTPYKVWQGDKWICHGCAATIVVGLGRLPFWEQHEGDLPEGDYTVVNDC